MTATISKTPSRLAGIIILSVLISCSGSKKTMRNEKKWFPLYWSGKQVGRASFDINVLQLSADSYIPFTTVTEDINYLGANYIFEFVLGDDLSRLTVMRYNPEKDVYISGDSYTLTFEDNTLHRQYYEEDGKNIRYQQNVLDKRRIAYTKELFKTVAEKLRAYYGYYIYSNGPYREHEKIQSIGYELLKFQKI